MLKILNKWLKKEPENKTLELLKKQHNHLVTVNEDFAKYAEEMVKKENKGKLVTVNKK